VTFLRLENLTKRFDSLTAVEDLSLSIERGEMLALLGPSGSGKTTTLRLLAGFEVPDRGRVWVEGDDVTGVEPSMWERTWPSAWSHWGCGATSSCDGWPGLCHW
jgi:ABC-type Fe3+/spermidine/putrescine transport system ATPase subunit